MNGLNRHTVLPFQCIVSAAVSAAVCVIQPQYLLHANNAEVTFHWRYSAGLCFCLPLPCNSILQISAYGRKMLKMFIATEIPILSCKYIFLLLFISFFMISHVRVSYFLLPVASNYRSLPGCFKSNILKNRLKINICVPVLQANFVSLCHQAPVGIYTALFFLYLESIHQ